MKRIELTHTVSRDRAFSFRAGEVVTVENTIADYLISREVAKLIEVIPDKVEEPPEPVETAAPETPAEVIGIDILKPDSKPRRRARKRSKNADDSELQADNDAE